MRIHSISSLTAMQSAVTRQDVTAHNVANVNTAGFDQSRVHQTDMVPRGTRISSIQKIPNRSGYHSGTDMVTQSVEQINAKSTMGFNAKMMKVQNRMTGELLDLLG